MALAPLNPKSSVRIPFSRAASNLERVGHIPFDPAGGRGLRPFSRVHQKKWRLASPRRLAEFGAPRQHKKEREKKSALDRGQGRTLPCVTYAPITPSLTHSHCPRARGGNRRSGDPVSTRENESALSMSIEGRRACVAVFMSLCIYRSFTSDEGGREGVIKS